ncbi:hypothetical protein [Paenibacillus physcomitrellae]|uniref:Uncharacterized protein n=1 Tax=Paenibacillus physcomitrellae TaxID=1619311 RepID=A0ABQ1FMY5_9BACL|nr:hypothetical protein [Paenibacillus physcomitrellae]GGA21691.1 hypothetical protein GCM10010917_03020 [Paenibacillus physcomitrellae]
MHMDNGNGDSDKITTYSTGSTDPLRGSHSSRLTDHEHSGSKFGGWINR